MIVNDRLQEYIIVGSGTNFKASDLGLELDHTQEHMNVMQTRLCIAQLRNETVNVVDGKGRVTASWKVVEKDVEDPDLSSERAKNLLEHGLCDFDFSSGDFNLCDLFFKLWPGDINAQLDLVNAQIRAYNKNLARKVFTPCGVSECTSDEFKTFIAILIGASCYHKGGEALWATKTKGIVAPPDFGRYMSHRRFKELRQHMSHAMSCPELKRDYDWWRVGGIIRDFNENQRKFVAAHQWKVLDELMSAFQPRTRKTGNLPNISFIIRKPKPLGTEFKCAGCPETGMMLGLEVQEGRTRMAKVSLTRKDTCDSSANVC